MEKLLKAEEYKRSYDQIEESTIEEFSSGKGIDFQRNAIIYNNPINKLKRFFEDFLINCVISIRKIVKVGELILDKKIEGTGELRKNLERLFLGDIDIIKMINEDSIWILELYNLRELVEHDELEIENLLIEMSDDNKVLIKLPKILKNQKLIREYMNTTIDN